MMDIRGDISKQQTQAVQEESALDALSRIIGYGRGHPWFYVRGGPVIRPRLIVGAVRARGYKGSMVEEISRADERAETSLPSAAGNQVAGIGRPSARSWPVPEGGLSAA